jgi:hypothetical protein
MARSTLPALPVDVPTTMVIGGVDTHLDVHVAAAVNQIGGLLGTASFPTTPLATPSSSPGWSALAVSCRSVWREPAATAPG